MSDTDTTTAAPTMPTADQIAAAQAVMAQAAAAEKAEADAAALAALTPVNAIFGPAFTASVTALRSGMGAVMAYNPSRGMAISNALTCVDHMILTLGADYTAAGGVAPTA